MIGYVPKVLNFNRSFLKLGRFIFIEQSVSDHEEFLPSYNKERERKKEK
jgi:hypothetical protein